jgi:hypothetical protein
VGVLIKYTGQAKHVVEQTPGEFSELESIREQYVKAMFTSRSYRIPRDVLMDTELADLEALQRHMTEYAAEHNLTVRVEQEVETGDYIVSWWENEEKHEYVIP